MKFTLFTKYVSIAVGILLIFNTIKPAEHSEYRLYIENEFKFDLNARIEAVTQDGKYEILFPDNRVELLHSNPDVFYFPKNSSIALTSNDLKNKKTITLRTWKRDYTPTLDRDLNTWDPPLRPSEENLKNTYFVEEFGKSSFDLYLYILRDKEDAFVQIPLNKGRPFIITQEEREKSRKKAKDAIPASATQEMGLRIIKP